MKARFSTLSTSNLNLLIVDQFDYVDEKLLHKLYKHKRIAKEWYNLSIKDIDDIRELDHQIKIEKQYER